MPLSLLHVEGLRTLAQVTLPLDGLTVLVGDNGSGKSSLLEVCALLRRVPGAHFFEELREAHGGVEALLRQGAPHLKLGVRILPAQLEAHGFAALEYEVVLRPTRSGAVDVEEAVRALPREPSTSPLSPLLLLHRKGPHCAAREGAQLAPLPLAVSPFLLLPAQPECLAAHPQCLAALQSVASHLAGVRHLAPSATSTAALGAAFRALRQDFGPEEWLHTLACVRLGLGRHVVDITSTEETSGPGPSLALTLDDLAHPLPASRLSAGQLAFLSLVALFRLPGGPRGPAERALRSAPSRPSLLAVDDVELHLHPGVVLRVLDMLEALAQDCPVLVATHSDALLDGLSEPTRAAVLCKLDEHGACRLLRPDARALAPWLERYGGLGAIRAEGHEASAFTREELVRWPLE